MGNGSLRLWYAFAALLFALALTAVFVVPYAIGSPTLGDDLTRNTVRVALVFYAVAVCMLLTLRGEDHEPRRLARFLWTLGWAAYLVHLAMAFHHYHRWSHADAVEHTRQVSGVGAGIYVSHLFTLVWTLDVAYWWLRPQQHAQRSVWITRLLHGFMAFIVFNGTVVYETGAIRWAGVLMFVVFGEFCLRRLRLADRGSARASRHVR